MTDLEKMDMTPPEDAFLADADEQMTVGIDCCPHYVPYGSDCDECDEYDADMAMGMTPNASFSGGPSGPSAASDSCTSKG